MNKATEFSTMYSLPGEWLVLVSPYPGYSVEPPKPHVEAASIFRAWHVDCLNLQLSLGAEAPAMSFQLVAPL